MHPDPGLRGSREDVICVLRPGSSQDTFGYRSTGRWFPLGVFIVSIQKAFGPAALCSRPFLHLRGCGHSKYSVIASPCAHWRGNPLRRGIVVPTTVCPGNLKEIATSGGSPPPRNDKFYLTKIPPQSFDTLRRFLFTSYSPEPGRSGYGRVRRRCRPFPAVPGGCRIR